MSNPISTIQVTVKQGDKLWTLLEDPDPRVIAWIAKKNNLDADFGLRPGQVLDVPASDQFDAVRSEVRDHSASYRKYLDATPPRLRSLKEPASSSRNTFSSIPTSETGTFQIRRPLSVGVTPFHALSRREGQDEILLSDAQATIASWKVNPYDHKNWHDFRDALDKENRSNGRDGASLSDTQIDLLVQKHFKNAAQEPVTKPSSSLSHGKRFAL